MRFMTVNSEGYRKDAGTEAPTIWDGLANGEAGSVLAGIAFGFEGEAGKVADNLLPIVPDNADVGSVYPR